MAIDTLKHYHPLHQYPVYLKLVPPRQNAYDVGEKYDMRLEDPERQEEKGGDGAFNYAHEALLVSVEEYKFGDVPNMLIALLGNSKSRTEALGNVCIGDEPYPEDEEVLLLTFLRLDKVKEFVENDKDIIPPQMSKKSIEGNGRGMD